MVEVVVSEVPLLFFYLLISLKALLWSPCFARPLDPNDIAVVLLHDNVIGFVLLSPRMKLESSTCAHGLTLNCLRELTVLTALNA